MAEPGSGPAGSRPSVTLIGGMRYRGSNASWPLAELAHQGSSLQIRLRYRWMRALLGVAFPTVTLELSDLERVDRLRGAVFPGDWNLGLRFVPRGEGRPVIFWCSRRKQDLIAGRLGEAGVPVGNPTWVL